MDNASLRESGVAINAKSKPIVSATIGKIGKAGLIIDVHAWMSVLQKSILMVLARVEDVFGIPTHSHYDPYQ